MTATVSSVDVGQGDCTVAVDDATGHALLIDCREGHHEAAIAELTRLEFTELRVAIVSHTHLDHFGGVLDVLEALDAMFSGTLYFNQDSLMAVPVAGEDRKVAGRKLRALVLRASEFGPDRVARAEAPTAPQAIGSLRWQVLAPIYDEVLAAIAHGDPNLASGVVLLNVGSNYVVIGGDAPLATWQRISGSIPKGAAVRWPHHGGSLGPDPDADAKVFDLLEPSSVIVSVGAANTHGHPTEDFFAVAGGGHRCALLCTQATSACVSGGGVGGACAGTIRIQIGGASGIEIDPDAHDHAAVIAGFGNGRCVAAPVRPTV